MSGAYGEPSAAGTIRRDVPAPAGRQEWVTRVVPDWERKATKSWRRLVIGIDREHRGARAFLGPWLDPGKAYELPVGGLVVACDNFSGRRWEVRILRVDQAELTEVKTWVLKAPLGKRVVDYAARRLVPDAPRHSAHARDVAENRWDGWCAYCHRPVAARAGQIAAFDGRTRVVHRPGDCPPPPPPREVIDPNRHPGLCFACGGWVGAGDGVAILVNDVPGTHRYRPMHKNDCPADAVPGPPNRVTDWCADCGELVHPGDGYWRDNELRHRYTCPAPALRVPAWVIRRGRGDSRIAVGEVLRVRVDLRTAGPPVPVDAPGYRALSATYVELVGVVTEIVERKRGRQRAKVRAATPAEAADVLAEEIGLVPDVRPAPAGFKARFTAEKIGHSKPWLAEITGRDPYYGFRRVFLRADRDYSSSNSKGTRGIKYAWTLTVNRVYEAWRPVTWSRAERLFLRSTPSGDVLEIDREEVEAWLNNAPVWPDI
jgi:hypothetical protein